MVMSSKKINNVSGKAFYITDTGTYTGSYQNGKKCGYGCKKYRAGDTYNGLWDNDTFSGAGEYNFENGEVMRGHFENGDLNGYGEYYWSDENYYKGYWVNDLWEGDGLRVWGNGMVYDGSMEMTKEMDAECSIGPTVTGMLVYGEMDQDREGEFFTPSSIHLRDLNQ